MFLQSLQGMEQFYIIRFPEKNQQMISLFLQKFFSETLVVQKCVYYCCCFANKYLLIVVYSQQTICYVIANNHNNNNYYTNLQKKHTYESIYSTSRYVNVSLFFKIQLTKYPPKSNNISRQFEKKKIYMSCHFAKHKPTGITKKNDFFSTIRPS